jgi:hypothetical protein
MNKQYDILEVDGSEVMVMRKGTCVDRLNVWDLAEAWLLNNGWEEVGEDE